MFSLFFANFLSAYVIADFLVSAQDVDFTSLPESLSWLTVHDVVKSLSI